MVGYLVVYLVVSSVGLMADKMAVWRAEQMVGEKVDSWDDWKVGWKADLRVEPRAESRADSKAGVRVVTTAARWVVLLVEKLVVVTVA